jgi:nucleoside phosphorylase
MGASAADPALSEATIAVITALSHEHVAVCRMLGCGAPIPAPGDGASLGFTYSLARITSRISGSHVVVVARLTAMGNNAAAFLAGLVKSHCPQLKHLIMCGIAGAVPNPRDASAHVRLGDIVVSNEDGVIQYDFGKEVSGGIQRRPRPRPAGAALLRAAQRLEDAAEEGMCPWESLINDFIENSRPDWARPATCTDRLFDSNDPTLDVPHPVDSLRQDGAPRVFFGPIASGNLVQKNAKRRDELRDEYRIIAFEMEGSGIADTAWELGLPYLIVRATCDYCDPAKNNQWQKYAAVAAAAYCRMVIECMAAASLSPSAARATGRLPTASDVADGIEEEVRATAPRSSADAVVLQIDAPRPIPEPDVTLVQNRALTLKNELETNLAVYEWNKVSESASELEKLLLRSQAQLPRALAVELYNLLARSAVAGERPPSAAAIARARILIERAKNV